ncbi:MAG: hypothetical protein AAB600_02900 [Patescibacteria group bacterium]
MKLPPISLFKKKNPFSYFLVLVLRNEKANAVIFEELDGKIRVIGHHAEYFENSIETASIDEMLDVLDRTISSAEESLPKNIEAQKTIFGLIESWVENDKIKKEYLLKLKKVCDELGLTPIGFLIITQAISHLLQKEEGAPVSAILTELGNKSITVTLMRVGRIIEAKSSEIHQSVPYTVDTLLKHFQTSEILPSRIILFDGEKDLSQEFISHSWSKSLPFLHLPQIATLPPNFDAKAVLFGAATQMGFEVLQEPKKKEGLNKEESIAGIDREVEKEQEEEYSSLIGFGFIGEKDITISPIAQKKEEPFDKAQAKQEIVPPKISKTKVNSLLVRVKDNLSVLSRLKKIPIAIPTSKKNIFIPIVVAASIALFFIYYLFGTSATVVLTIKPRIIEQNKNVSFSTSTTSDPSKGVIAGETVSVSEEGSNSIATTGKKEIGSHAKGKVTIFNSLTQEKTLPQATIIRSPNGLEFTLDDSLTLKGVASHSADETVSPTTAQVSVTARQIGKELNLPSATKFSVSNFDTSDIVAKNDSPFGGGTKKEVTVVSKNDVDKLLEELPKLLVSRAKDDIAKQISKDKSLLPIFTNKTLGKKKLDKEIGEQADKITLNATVIYESIAYKNDDLKSLSRSLVQNNISNNMTINYENVKIDIKDVTQNKDNISANLRIKALLQPIIDKKSLVSELSGVSYKIALAKLSKIPQVSDINISFSPNIPFLPKILTKTSKNIKIIVNVNE